jgi:transposase-like protein
MAKTEYTHEEKRKVLLEHRYLYTADKLCAKWGISKSQLSKWKKEFNYSYFIGSLHDMAIVALYNGAQTILAIINYLDALNHARYTEKEVLELLKGLQAEGIAKTKDGEWFYDKSYSKNDTSFIF